MGGGEEGRRLGARPCPNQQPPMPREGHEEEEEGPVAEKTCMGLPRGGFRRRRGGGGNAKLARERQAP